MPRKCCIQEYYNSQGNKLFQTNQLSFHSFPTEQKLLDVWLSQIKINDGKYIPDVHRHKICSGHFLKSQIISCGTRFFLKEFAVPSIFPRLESTNGKADSQIFVSTKVNGKRKSINDSAPVFTPKRKANSADDLPNSISYDCVISSHNCNAESFKIDSSNIDIKKGFVSQSALHLNNLEEFIVPDVIGLSMASCDSNFPGDDFVNSVSQPDLDSKNLEESLVLNVNDSVESVAHSTPKRSTKRNVRYPGDINEEEEMSTNTAKSNIRLCKTKIQAQAKQIYKLKQTVRRQKKQIEALKQLWTTK